MADASAMIIDTFKKFDMNQDGFISQDELKRVLGAISGGQLADSDVKAILEASDTNKDGKIQYEEFVAWVTKDMAGPTSPEFKPLDKRGSFQVDYRTLLPQRFQVDVNDRYSMDKKDAIGEGGFGKVFIARDKEFSGRLVAVKQTQKPRAGSPEISDLDKEIAVMKELDHPNICKLLATFQEGRSLFFVMELCEGGELFDRIIETGNLSEQSAAVILQQVCSALAYAHGRGIAHRDIKPENVVFCTKDKADTRVKLIDWGLATEIGGEGMVKAVGSMTYAAPEVINSQDRKSYTEACDIWSIGVLTYVMLCGKPPFWGTREQHFRAAKNERYPFKQDPWDKQSMDEAKDFISKCLKAEGAQRIKINDALTHKWLAKREESSVTQEQSVAALNNLKSFAAQSTFTKLCVSAVARQLDHKHLKDIHAVFKELDLDGNGVLSDSEIKAGMAKLGGDAKSVDAIFEGLDLDGSKSIDYTEFCAAALDAKSMQQDEISWAAFKTFDIDNSGFISVDNLKNILDNADVKDTWSSDVCLSVGQEIMEKFDKTGDQQISFEEFKDIMAKCWEKQTAQPALGGAGGGSLGAYALLQKVNIADLSRA